MAGYIFNLDNTESLRLYATHGVYATKLSPPKGRWGIPQEGTFADYATMRPGDNVYFFIKRRVYGIGELIDLDGRCRFSNFPAASQPQAFDYRRQRPHLLWDESDRSVDQRWLCAFKPAPHFFMSGVDMDDVLMSSPDRFRMLRALWKLSFIKFDDSENQAFKDVILKHNQTSLAAPQEGENVFPYDGGTTHTQLSTTIAGGDYELDVRPILASCADGPMLRHEMAIEAGALFQLTVADPETTKVFSNWDYLTHQVIASPFKPIDYMDKMDLFGYAYIPGYAPTIANYFVGEIKRSAADEENIDQLLKYVDWVKDDYAHGDYGMIRAFLIASEFPDRIVAYAREVGNRRYTIGRRPALSLAWTDLNLVTYQYEATTGRLRFQVVDTQ